MSKCNRCNGIIMEADKPYSYAGKICRCVYPESVETKKSPVAENATTQIDSIFNACMFKKECQQSNAKINTLRAQLDVAVGALEYAAEHIIAGRRPKLDESITTIKQFGEKS